jgi:hypothetical protein
LVIRFVSAMAGRARAVNASMKKRVAAELRMIERTAPGAT